MKEVLIWFAALIPIAASLWVASRALTRHRSSVEEFKIMAKIERDFLDRRRSSLQRGRSAEDAEWDARAGRRAAIEAAGLPYWETLSNAAARSYLDEPPLSGPQERDQWVLIWASVAGVFLLALSLLV